MDNRNGVRRGWQHAHAKKRKRSLERQQLACKRNKIAPTPSGIQSLSTSGVPEDVVNSAFFMPEATHGSAGRMNPCTPADAHDDAECESDEEPLENNTKNATSDVESNSSDDGKEGRNRRVDDTDGKPAAKIRVYCTTWQRA